MFRYASALGLEAVTPFWPQPWFTYVDGEGDALDPGYNRAAVAAAAAGKRTRYFEALRQLAGSTGK